MKRYWVFLFLGAVVLAQSSPEVEITAEPHHHLVLANDQVRVFSVEVAPHSETLMHWHRHDYIYVTLGAVEVVNAVKGKDPVTIKLQDGETRFLPATFAHVARNLSDQAFRNVTIEILQDDKLRKSPPPAGSGRGLEILHGGTKEILFVKDGIRASEGELQPGGMIPQHSGLIVAVSDLEMRSDGAGKSPAAISLKMGESKWMPGGNSYAITNSGSHQARFIMLEFP